MRKIPERKKLRKKPRCLHWQVRPWAGVASLSVACPAARGSVLRGRTASQESGQCPPGPVVAPGASPRRALSLLFAVRFSRCCGWWAFAGPSRGRCSLAGRTRELTWGGDTPWDGSASARDLRELGLPRVRMWGRGRSLGTMVGGSAGRRPVGLRGRGHTGNVSCVSLLTGRWERGGRGRGAPVSSLAVPGLRPLLAAPDPPPTHSGS